MASDPRKTARGGVQGQRGRKVKQGVRPIPQNMDWLQVKGVLQDLSNSLNENRWFNSLFSGFGDKERKTLESNLKDLANTNDETEKTFNSMQTSIDKLKSDIATINSSLPDNYKGVVKSDGTLAVSVDGVSSAKLETGVYRLTLTYPVTTDNTMVLVSGRSTIDPVNILYNWSDTTHLKVIITDKTDVRVNKGFSFYIEDLTP